jgi:uncharacterized protein (TIGR03435 family)
MNRVVTVLVVSLFVPVAAVFSQNVDTPRFEVASVRLSTAPGTLASQRMTDTRVDIINVSLRSLLLLAFRAKEYQLAAPDWLTDARVNVQGTMTATATRQQVPEMIQQLLAERFRLVVHRELRPIDTYELVVGPRGHKMRGVEPVDEFDKVFPVSEVAKQLGTPALMDTTVDTTEGPVRTVFTDTVARTIVTRRTMYQLTSNVQRRSQTLDATRMTMAELAALLTNNMDESVLDKTGLEGFYQFRVELPIDATIVKAARTLGLIIESTGIAESTAVENLGLRLELRRTPVEVVVVDDMNRTPTEN